MRGRLTQSTLSSDAVLSSRKAWPSLWDLDLRFHPPETHRIYIFSLFLTFIPLVPSDGISRTIDVTHPIIQHPSITLSLMPSIIISFLEAQTQISQSPVMFACISPLLLGTNQHPQINPTIFTFFGGLHALSVWSLSCKCGICHSGRRTRRKL
jgi:hypothetical protein